ncbi:MAG: orotidine-5'-phosphate decarboxylase [Lactobacillales bacterium]|jgi:orotidine-5'-phosphate decarboxylase|nr:orotidine-5'-phosphate decarboxylase [Lactobacillales bacterium]
MHRPIIALDFQNRGQVDSFLGNFPEEEKLYVKVGMELYYAEGPEIVRSLKAKGHSVFVDLKCHDIPNTVKGSVYSLTKLGIDIVNCHAAGGIKMMEAAVEGAREGAAHYKTTAPIVIAVTQLTSTSQEELNEQQKIPGSIQDAVVNYAGLAKKAGLAGVVCSAQEVDLIKEACGKDFVCLTPGIRPTGVELGDQTRVMTPYAAREIGSDFIVVGRPITQADNPYEAYLQIKKEWNSFTK